jgi:glycosyltransferase involved in cell wall biosynthesis
MAKIVYFIDHLRPDGTQTFLLSLVSGLASSHEQQVIALNRRSDPAMIQAFEDQGATVMLVGLAQLLSGIGMLRIVKLLRNYQPDVSLTLLFGGHIVGRLCSAYQKVPRVVSSFRVSLSHFSRWQRLLLQLTSGLVDAVVLTSRQLLGQDQGGRVIPLDKTYVISNSVDTRLFRDVDRRAALVETYNLEPGRPILAAMGRLVRQKGFDVLLDAAAQSKRHDVQLLIAGRGVEQRTLQLKINQLGLADRVQLIGHVHDVPGFMAGVDLYIHPARYEGTPNSVMQAMACGRMVIATGVDGILDLIDDGQQGVLVAAESPGELAGAIDRVLATPELIHAFGQRARKRMQTDFSPETKIAEWQRLLVPSAKQQ